jgi:hypothetical protein
MILEHKCENELKRGKEAKMAKKKQMMIGILKLESFCVE